MSGEECAEQSENDASEAMAQTKARTRQRSAIGFPYTDLQAALDVANAIHTHAGNGDCSLPQLAAWLKLSVKSSGLRVQLSAARTFGLTENEGSERYRLTDLGRRIVDPNQARGARADAFLNVPLFRALFANHNTGVLPPAAALEREIASLGVAEKQKVRARQVFERSADQAGFFEHGRDRLVEPAVRETPPRTPPHDPPQRGGNGGGGDEGGLSLDPLLMALLRRVPKPKDGWPSERRVRWLRTFVMNISQIYDDDEKAPEITIEVRQPADGGSDT
jgi:hypothetical protein